MSIVGKLRHSGIEIDESMINKCLLKSRHIRKPHIAEAILNSGQDPEIRTIDEALTKYLNKGRVGFIPYNDSDLPRSEEIVEIFLENGVIPVWAHPYHRLDVEETLLNLSPDGLVGIELKTPQINK